MTNLLAIRVWLCATFVCLFVLSSCKGDGVVCGSLVGDTIAMRHSALLQMVDCDSFLVAEIKNPWREGVLHRYVLVPEGVELPNGAPRGTLLRTPLKNALLFSSVHASLFEELGCANIIKGVCDAPYIFSRCVREGVAVGDITDCGSSLDVDIERVVELSPGAIFVFPYENGGYGKLEKLKYPIVECAEYMETSPLASAEWVRFYGRLLGLGVEADSLFNAVCERYERLASLVDDRDKRPTLMCELKSGSAWYVPTGESTMGQMYHVAGADYLFADGKGSGSRPLSFETVLARAADADFWLLKYNAPVDKTRESLLGEYSGYAHFKPFKEGAIYACNTAKKPIFEDGAFRPDLLLAELVAIFHSSLMGEYKLNYYERMP